MFVVYLLVFYVAVFVGVLGAAYLVPWRFARLGHYVSTYCIHNLHDDCRLTCKTCEKRCRCRCHKEATDD